MITQIHKLDYCSGSPANVGFFCKTPIFFSCLCVFAAIFFYNFSCAQVEKKYIRDGNKKYSEGKYEEAEKIYEQALEKNTASNIGKFNKADALYKQEKYEEAAQQFGNVAQNTSDKNLKAQAYHNLGNSFLQSQKLKEAVDSYKNALRANPNDEDTRKNLAYAMKMLQEQQQQKQNEKNDKNENKENKDQQQNEKNEEKKDEQKQNQEQQQNEQQKQEQQQAKQKDQLSKQEAQRLLESMNNDEKKLQEKLKMQKMQMQKVQPVQIEKDW